jgi:peptidoglycan/xylan/chitin deacetylase (PgdA/CDA1 family)
VFKPTLAAAVLLLAACAGGGPAAPPASAAAPVRFLLSFDDGPAPSSAWVLEALADNPVQPGIKAIFFVQTRAADAGGSPRGRELMRREYAEGHLLGVHSGTPRGHVSHMALSTEELEESLAQAKADIAAVTGAPPRFVRPPFWFYDADALACYRRSGLAMLLTDINALDGVVLGINVVPGKRYLIRSQLERIKRELEEGALPQLDGATPVVATFHDVNTGTARDLRGYLQMLVEEAHTAGLAVAEHPFYDRREDLERAAGLRARQL